MRMEGGGLEAVSTRKVGQARHSESAKSSRVAVVTAARNERVHITCPKSVSGGA